MAKVRALNSTSETLKSDEMVDGGPVLEADDKDNAIAPTAPPTFSIDDETVAKVGPYEGPVPPVDAVLLAQWNVGVGLGITSDVLASYMFTVRMQAGGEGRSATLSIADVDLPDGTDSVILNCVKPGAGPATHLTGTAILGAVRKQ